MCGLEFLVTNRFMCEDLSGLVWVWVSSCGQVVVVVVCTLV